MKILVHIVALFILAQIIGLYIGFVVAEDSFHNPYIKSLYIQQGEGGETLSDLVFLFAIMLSATAFLLILIKYYKGKLLFMMLEFFIVSSTSSVFFYSIIRNFISYLESMVLGIAAGIVFAFLKLKNAELKNAAAVISVGVVGAVFGLSFSPLFIIAFMGILVVYDFISVFKTKHMVEMAEFVVKKDMPFTISAKQKLPGKKIQRMDLGTGDLLAPVTLEVSLLKYSFGAAFLVFLGALVSIFAVFYLVRKRRVILPALPPIFAGMMAGLIASVVLGLFSF
ncbi:hypothetical protein JXB01_01415 [Candidatus Micrarchaeota archaeon]|nr:hypothetical protein [Candidatus Micrarchaeota archaeon]